jgi:hypothetical protein
MHARRYVGWLDRHALAILVVNGALLIAAGLLVAFHLPVRAAFSYLLPSDAPSVRAADELGRRVPARDSMLVLIEAPDAARRAAATAQATAELATLIARAPELVERIEADDTATRAFIAARAELFVPTAELTAARDALRDQVATARRAANPLYIDFDDDVAPAASGALDALRAKQRDAAARLAKPAFVSADGRTQVIIVRTAFVATDVSLDHRLQAALDDIARDLRVRDPSLAIGFAGGVPATIAEQHALVHGVLLSTLITGALVAFVLFVHLRSPRLLALLVANIAAATLVAFGIAALTVGHLNAATAFLGAIVAGNGVNYGILLVARYGEERPAFIDARDALARAIAGTLRPTLVASLGAAIAYGALGATKFRGFADFALIGSVGMLVCWVASFIALPVLLLRLAPGPRAPASPLFGRLVARVFGIRRAAVAVAISGVVLAGSAAISMRYLTGDPYEYDMSQLRSQAPDAESARAWLRVADREFGRGLAGMASQTYVVVDDARDVPAVVDSLHAIAARAPAIGKVTSILDVIPPDQARRIALLDELRARIDDAAPWLDDAHRAELAELRPADGLAPVTAAQLPDELRAKLRERDGRIGDLISVKPSAAFDDNNGHDLIAFAAALRDARTADGRPVVAAGASLLFADVLLQIQRDGPRVTALAALGLVVMVVLVVGPRRRALAVLVAAAAGSLAMIAACAVAGLRINFLDFVALPITLGLGIDYAINMADRAGETGGDPRPALRSTGGTVFVCSLTTMIGYASLLVSDNRAIRGFGLASLIGEITCVAAALAIVPAIMALGRGAGTQRSVACAAAAVR